MSLTVRTAFSLPDILPHHQPGHIHFYAHTAREHDHRAMITLTTCVLSIILSGRKRLQLGDERREFSAGDFIIFKAGNCLSTDMSVDGAPYRSLLVFFDAAHLRPALQRLGVMPRTAPLSRLPFISLNADKPLKDLSEYLWHTSNLAALSTPLRALKLEEILLLLIEAHGADLFDFFAELHPHGSQTRLSQVVEAHWSDNLSLDELAFLSHLSLSTFKRKFHAAYGLPPGQWLQNRRLELAAHLLTVEQRRASDIYADVGFASLSAFTQSFRTRFGLPPRAYQTQHLTF